MHRIIIELSAIELDDTFDCLSIHDVILHYRNVRQKAQKLLEEIGNPILKINDLDE